MKKTNARKNGTPAKPFGRMTAKELADATAEFDLPTPAGPATLPAPAKERARLDRAMGRGRPTVGAGAERINISLERTLLRAADDWADAHGMTRSQLIALGIKTVLKTRPGVAGR